jgi:hypothetical protein
VDQKQRHRRLRLLIRRLNKERKKQAQKIDLLCNDFILTQREFIERLNTIHFTANFYESILGATDLSSLLYTAGKLIKDEIPDSYVAFFLPGFTCSKEPQKETAFQRDNFEWHVFESDQPITLEKQHLKDSFTPELVENICKSNKLCTLDDMFAMGLQDNPVRLSRISAITVPLCRFGSSLGFVLIYRLSQKKLTHNDLKNISAVTCGLSRAIQSYQIVLNSAD